MSTNFNEILAGAILELELKMKHAFRQQHDQLMFQMDKNHQEVEKRVAEIESKLDDMLISPSKNMANEEGGTDYSNGGNFQKWENSNGCNGNRPNSWVPRRPAKNQANGFNNRHRYGQHRNEDCDNWRVPSDHHPSNRPSNGPVQNENYAPRREAIRTEVRGGNLSNGHQQRSISNSNNNHDHRQHIQQHQLTYRSQQNLPTREEEGVHAAATNGTTLLEKLPQPATLKTRATKMCTEYTTEEEEESDSSEADDEEEKLDNGTANSVGGTLTEGAMEKKTKNGEGEEALNEYSVAKPVQPNGCLDEAEKNGTVEEQNGTTKEENGTMKDEKYSNDAVFRVEYRGSTESPSNGTTAAFRDAHKSPFSNMIVFHTSAPMDADDSTFFGGSSKGPHI